MSQPLVSIICLCYNHARFLKEALDSALAQTYPNVELIVVDDSSTDNSAAIIEEYCSRFPQLKFIRTGRNVGNTSAFNMGWRESEGAFVIDFATDDVLLPERVEKQVNQFLKLPLNYGVVYSDAEYIDDNGKHLHLHSQKHRPAPDGDVFAEILKRYFICPPTMMIRREVLEELNGYDETLAYEDFDFWVRSARNWNYSYLPEVTTRRRMHPKSLSKQYYTSEGKMLRSTLKVCEKAANLLRTNEEKAALINLLKYEIRHAYLTDHFQETTQFFNLLQQLTSNYGAAYYLINWLSYKQLSFSFVRRLYYRFRYGQ